MRITRTKTIFMLIPVYFYSNNLHASNKKYICSSQDISGFSFYDGRWVAGPLKGNDAFLLKRYDVIKNKPLSVLAGGTSGIKKNHYNYAIKNLSSKYWIGVCMNETEFKHADLTDISCTGFSGFSFDMNTKNLRFEAIYEGGYIASGIKDYDTPMIQIGKCTTF